MDHEPLPNDVILAIEACRPDRHDDLLPEVAAALANVSPVRLHEVRRSIERVDRAIMAAVQQSPVPEGLSDRVLAQIRAGATEQRLNGAESGDQAETSTRRSNDAPSTGVVELAAKKSAGGWRRSRMAAIAGFALAASLLVAFVTMPRGTVELAEVQVQARELYDVDDHDAGLSTDNYPTPLSGVSAGAIRGWRRITFLDRSGVAYELAKGRVKATLYVVPQGAWFGPKLNVPLRPSPQSTLGMTVAAWTDNADVYILVVKGGEPAFWTFLPRSVA